MFDILMAVLVMLLSLLKLAELRRQTLLHVNYTLGTSLSGQAGKITFQCKGPEFEPWLENYDPTAQTSGS